MDSLVENLVETLWTQVGRCSSKNVDVDAGRVENAQGCCRRKSGVPRCRAVSPAGDLGDCFSRPLTGCSRYVPAVLGTVDIDADSGVRSQELTAKTEADRLFLSSLARLRDSSVQASPNPALVSWTEEVYWLLNAKMILIPSPTPH